jgi:Putative mono-oxygenase ydhR
MSVVLFVRVQSALPFDELERRMLERKPAFLEVPGLIQKIYGRDPGTGDVCGIYFFESREALAAFRETDLARTIAGAYEATDVRREAFDAMYPLRPDVGPISDTAGG